MAMQKHALDVDLSPAHLLLHLQSLHGIIYLQDHGKPVIGFLPKSYWLQQHNQFDYFERQSDLSYLKTHIQSHLPSFELMPSLASSQSHHDGFTGGWMGFIGYDAAAKQHISAPTHTQPALYFGLYHCYLKQEHEQWFFYCDDDNEKILNMLQQLLHQPYSQPQFKLTSPCCAEWTKTHYIQKFNQIQDYIRSGDCYQINLTQPFKAQAQGTLLTTAEQFWTLTHAPYSGYLKIGQFELLSCSPELFVEFQTNKLIKTRPIKGTMPRYLDDPKQDEQSKQTLKSSEKDQAENVMIVDLLRNDLSVYAEIGSVHTTKLFEIESFQQVHHMVSEIQATLKSNIQPIHVLFNALPGGSITGAPKIRAMQIIHELEEQPRGAYCGSLGYFNHNGTGCWNILIRSIQKYNNDLSIWAGGGITIASDVNAEYQECLDKISAMQHLLNTWYTPSHSHLKCFSD